MVSLSVAHRIMAVDTKTILLVFPIIFLIAISSTTIVSAHTAAYMIGFNAGKADGLNGIYDIGDTCNQQNGTSIITTTDSDHCNTGYDDGWNKTCHIGLTKFPDPDYNCPGISKEKLQQLQNQQNTPPALLKQDEEWCKPYYENTTTTSYTSDGKAFCEQLRTERCPAISNYEQPGVSPTRFCKS